MPRMFYISKIDEENSDYYNSLHKLQKQFGVSVAPIVVPIFEGNRDTVGIVDCVIRKAYRMEGNKRVEIPIPDNMKDRIDQHRAALCENIAELSEDLMAPLRSISSFHAFSRFRFSASLSLISSIMKSIGLFTLLLPAPVPASSSVISLASVVESGPKSTSVISSSTVAPASAS